MTPFSKIRFLDDGRIEIDSNTAERSIRLKEAVLDAYGRVLNM